MGDIMTFVEQAQEKMDMEEQAKAASKMMSGKFTLDDMLMQIRQMNKLGSLGGIMKMIPGMSQMAGQIDEAKAEGSNEKDRSDYSEYDDGRT